VKKKRKKRKKRKMMTRHEESSLCHDLIEEKRSVGEFQVVDVAVA
jgi:hypothetical protein